MQDMHTMWCYQFSLTYSPFLWTRLRTETKSSLFNKYIFISCFWIWLNLLILLPLSDFFPAVVISYAVVITYFIVILVDFAIVFPSVFSSMIEQILLTFFIKGLVRRWLFLPFFLWICTGNQYPFVGEIILSGASNLVL